MLHNVATAGVGGSREGGILKGGNGANGEWDDVRGGLTGMLRFAGCKRTLREEIAGV